MKSRARKRCLAAVAIAACAVLPFAAVADTGVNVLNNGGFEKFSGGRRAIRWSYGRGWRAVEGEGVKGSRALVYEEGPLRQGCEHLCRMV